MVQSFFSDQPAADAVDQRKLSSRRGAVVPNALFSQSLIAAAKAAGMRVFAYVGGAHTDRDAVTKLGATVFTEMRELPRLLAAG